MKNKIITVYLMVFAMICGQVFAASFSDGFESYSPVGAVTPPTGNINTTGAPDYGWYGSNFAQYNRITLVDTHNSPWDVGGSQSAALVRTTGAALDSHLFNYFDDRAGLSVTGSIGRNFSASSGILGFSWDFYMTNVPNDRPRFDIFGEGGVTDAYRAITFDLAWVAGSDFNFRTYDGTTAVTSGSTLAEANEWYRVVISNLSIETKAYDIELLRWNSGNPVTVMSHQDLGFFTTTTGTSTLGQFRAHTSSNLQTRIYYVDNFEITQDSPQVAAHSPIPVNGADNLGISDIILSWSNYDGVTISKVYFGTSAELDAPGDYKGEQADETYSPGVLQPATTYYWRIDQVYDGDTFTGEVWSFTTASIDAMNDKHSEYFEDFNLGDIHGQFGWSGDAVVPAAWNIVSTSGSGIYPGGKGVSVKENNVWLTFGFGGDPYRIPIISGTSIIELSADVRVGVNDGINIMLRFGSPEFSPMFGYMLDGSVRKFWARESNLGAATFGSPQDAAQGDWIRMSMVYDMTTGRGDIIAYNLTTDSPMSTGLSNLNLGLWSGSRVGYVLRHHSSSETIIDNLRLMAYRPMARYCIPADSAKGIGTATGDGISGMPMLSWTKYADSEYSEIYSYGSGISERFYIGTTPENMNYMDDVNGSYILPFSVDMATTYYWRVDTVIDGTQYRGQRWHFTTDAPKAHNPIPEDGGVVEDNDSPVLKWTSFKDYVSYEGTISQSLYFGENPGQLAFEADITTSQYTLPYMLEGLKHYYWRIDTTIDSVVYQGDVWSFIGAIGSLNYPRKLAYEGFDYVTGTLGTKGNSGIGWDSSWQRGVDSSCPLYIGQGSLSPGMDYLLGTQGNRVHSIGRKYTADYDGGVRKLSYPIQMSANQDYYISFLVMCDNNTFNQASFWLMDERMGGNTLFAAHLYEAGHHATIVPTPKFSLRSPSNDWYNRVFDSWDSGVVYMVVIKISASAGGEDRVSMIVFDSSRPLPVEEPSSWDATFTTQSDLSYSWIRIDGVGDQFDQWNIDEIHIGTGWGAVTGWTEACGDFGTIMPWDFNQDCQVNYGDISVLANEWMRCTDPAFADCEWAIDENDPNFVGLFTALDSVETLVYETDEITVDGDLSEWGGSRWYNARFTGGFNHQNASDVIDARLAMKWIPTTPEKVYLAVKVKDVNHSFATDPTAWNSGDNIEVRFTYNDTSSDTAWYTDRTFDTAQYYQLFPLLGGGTKANLGPMVDPRDAGEYTTVEYATSVVGDEIHYEMAVPVYVSYNIGSKSGSTATLSEGDIVAFNIQFNSVNDDVVGALFNNQSHNPQDWAKFKIIASSSLTLGDMGFFTTDINRDGYVDLTDFSFVAERWLSCTDPQIEGCDQPWLP